MPTPSKAVNPNLKSGTAKNPVIIEAMAPFSEKLDQTSDNIIVGQKVAAMPDHPNIANQNIVLSGDVIAIINATQSANNANDNVMTLEICVICFSVLLGLKIC